MTSERPDAKQRGRSEARFGRPVPTQLSFALIALGLLPALLMAVKPAFGLLALGIDVGVLVLIAVDFFLAPKPSELEVSRELEPVLSSGVANRIRLRLSTRSGRRLRGQLRELVPLESEAKGQVSSFDVRAGLAETVLDWVLTPLVRGDLALGDLWVRMNGPLQLCARQFPVPLGESVKVYPDLKALTREALSLALAAEESAERTVRRTAEGREFESLREYRAGDDYRAIDWKATARKARTMVRQHQPERNQVVMLLLDCGRHMAGRVGARRKLDHAVDAALRLAKVSLDQGDRVGVVAFANGVKAHLPPVRGTEGLKLLAGALYKVEAALEESDYGKALELAFARQHKRALVVTFTDLLDKDTSEALVRRVLSLRPRHLPMVASLLDEELAGAARAVPVSTQDAYVRHTAARLEDDYRLTATQLRDAGALVVRSAPSQFSAATVNEYLRVKARGLL